jgi:SAM-dependent methyltransferase
MRDVTLRGPGFPSAPYGRPPEIATIDELNDFLSRFIRDRFQGDSALDILEAGCGNRWPLELGKLDVRLTGVDIDKRGLDLRQANEGDLDRAIHADLCTVDLEPEQFDVIYCSYVLEHVAGAERALENFLRWLKPGGYVLLKFPDRNSVFGLCTRLMPFRLHVLYKKYIYRLPHAGEPGYGPFPTVYDEIVSRRGIHAFCDRHGIEICAEYCTNFYMRRLGGLRPFVRALVKGVELISFRRFSGDYNNLVYILRKLPPSNTAR